MKQFAHLHVHTEFSLFDGAVRINEVFELCDKLNIPAIAITDHGNMYGVIEFLEAAVRHTELRVDFLKFMSERRPFKVKPIIGCEVCMTDDTHAREKNKNGAPPKLYHLVLLAKNEVGYHNLIKIVSKGYIEGTYHNPHVDFEFIKAHSEGLIALSACLAGIIPQAILENDFALADSWIKKFKAVFGDDFYVEIQNHNMDKQKIVLPHLIRLARENAVKVVATNDAHYLTKDDSEMQKVLLAISEHSVSGNADVGADMSDNNFFLTDEFCIKSYDEMYAALPYEDALATSLEIAGKCDPYFFKKENLLPSYTPPNGMKPNEFLRKLTFDGLKARYGEITDEIKTRAEHELEIIERLKHIDYFLIVWNLVHWAEKHDIPVGPGCGSSTGCIVAYALGITKIDPLKYELIFEKFLNPEQERMRSIICIDICAERRGEVIEYATKKYGVDYVLQIAALDAVPTKQVVRDVGRVYNYPDSEVEKIVDLIPANMTGSCLAYILKSPKWNDEESDSAINKLNEMYERNETARAILDMATKIERLPRQVNVHTTGVIISREPIAERVPIARTKDGVVVTQYGEAMNYGLGFLKMDFCGLPALTDIKRATDCIKRQHGVDIDFAKIGYDDPNVYKLIASGDTDGVFGMESSEMKNIMREIQPSILEDLMAGIALSRPWMNMDIVSDFIKNKKNRDKIEYVQSPSRNNFARYLRHTVIYQEEVINLVHIFAGCSKSVADNVRRIIGQRKAKKIAAFQEIFINGGVYEKTGEKIPGAVANGVPADVANKIYEKLCKFTSYSFSKSHAAAY